MEVHDKHHHATVRLLIGLVSLIVIGIAIYLVITYASVQGVG